MYAKCNAPTDVLGACEQALVKRGTGERESENEALLISLYHRQPKPEI